MDNHIEGMSAHSDIADALVTARSPLGDVQLFCRDWQQYRYVVASTKTVIFGLALGMKTIGLRLDERMKARALALRFSAMIGPSLIGSSGHGRLPWRREKSKDEKAQQVRSSEPPLCFSAR